MKRSKTSSRAATERWPTAWLCAALWLCLAAPAAAEGVALAVHLPSAGSLHRDFAAGVVAEAYTRWQMLSPQLPPEAVEGCQAEERCLVELSAAHKARHLLLVGIAPLGGTDFVASIKLLSAGDGKELVAYSDLGTPGLDPKAAGAALAKRIFTAVSDVTPPRGGPAAAAGGTGAPAPYDGLSPLALTGWAVVGTSGALALGALALGAATTATPELVSGSGGVEAVTQVATVLVAAGAATGLGVVALDAFLPHEAPAP